jgi:hypothetical protein
MRSALYFTLASFAQRTILYTVSKFYNAEQGLNMGKVTKSKVPNAR